MRAIVAAIMAAVAIAGLALPAAAADVGLALRWRGSMQFHQLPFARSERAQAIWDERACWSACGAHTAWNMATCLQLDAQGRCLRFADKADRACQRECRTMGGPYVPDIFDF